MNKAVSVFGSLVLTGFFFCPVFSSESDSKAFPPDPSKPDLKHYRDAVRPVLLNACMKCHAGEEPEGDFRIDNLDPDLEKGKDAAKWEEVLNQVQAGEMPPKSEKPLGNAYRELVTTWLHKEMQRAAELKASTGGRGVIRRLTRYEYNYTIQDLMELPVDVTKAMPEDRGDPTGLKNNGQHLGMTTSQLEMYFDSATTALQKAMVAPEKPNVYQHRKDAAAGKCPTEDSKYTALRFSRMEDHVASGPGVKVPEGVKLPPGAFNRFDFMTPRSGPFRISFVAGGQSDLKGNPPRLQLWFGYEKHRDSGIFIRKMIAEVAVDAPIDKPKEYVIHGYLDELPLIPSDDERDQIKRPQMVYFMHAYASKDAFEHAQAQYNAVEAQSKAENQAKAEARTKAKAKGGTPAKDPVKPDSTLGELLRQISRTSIPEKDPAKPDSTPEHGPTILLQSFDFQAPYFESWPPKSRVAVLGAAAGISNPASRARETLTEFTARAWRRPVMSQEIDPLVKLFESFYKNSQNYDDAMRETLATALLSPKFLYIVEPIGDARRNLTAHELASRLSYFLWCSLPDAELRKLADSGELTNDAVLAGQVQRMLADPKARRFVDNFTEQWLETGQIERTAVNPEYYPNFKDELKESFQKEPTELFWHILTNRRSAMEFLSSDYVLVNQALADHYGLNGVIGSEFRPVKVSPEDHRGGLLTMGGFMLANSNGGESHPILRGKWLLKNLMNQPPPPPPPVVSELNQIEGFEKMTLKRQLEIHRDHAACMSCHSKLDPWGLALENYDAIGQWRTVAKKIPGDTEVAKAAAKAKPAEETPVITTPVDSVVQLPDGTTVNGVDELKDYCVRVKGPDFAQSLTRKIFGYALGRSLEWTDRTEVDELAKGFADSDFDLQRLIKHIVLSQSFRTR